MDTLLITKGETARRFEVGIGVDVQNPFRESQRMLAAPIVLQNQRGPAEPRASWLFHADARNVVTTSWDYDPEKKCRMVARFAETEGKMSDETRLLSS